MSDLRSSGNKGRPLTIDEILDFEFGLEKKQPREETQPASISAPKMFVDRKPDTACSALD